MGVVFHDDFTNNGSDENIEDHTPSDVGIGWTEQANTSITSVRAWASFDMGRPITTDTTAHILVTSDPDPTEADVDLEVHFESIFFATALHSIYLIARWQDIDDWYAIECDEGKAFGLWKSVAGTITQIGSNGATQLGTGDELKLEIRGAVFKVYVDTGSGYGSAEIDETDSSHSAAGKCGLQYGIDGDGENITTAFASSVFKVTEFAPPGGPKGPLGHSLHGPLGGPI